MKKQKLNGILSAFLPVLLILFLVLIVAPIEIYSANVDGFTYDIYDLLVMMFPVFLLASAAAFCGCLLLSIGPDGLLLAISALCLSLFFALYILGNFFSGNLPPLDGSVVDWHLYDSQRLISVIVCVLSLSFFSALLFFLKKDKYQKASKYICAFFGAMLLISSVLTVLSGSTARKKEDLAISSDHLLKMSSDTNFIILLLDSISADAFQTALKDSPQYEHSFDDFTFFRNTVGAYPFTEQTIPFLFSGDWYENDESYYAYKINAYKNSPLFSYLKDMNYRMSLYEEDVPASSACLQCFDNALCSDTFRFRVPLEFIKTQIKLAGLKYFPYDLKRFCLVAPDYLYANSQKQLNMDSVFSWDNIRFFEAVGNGEIETLPDKCFKFIHLCGAHQPFMLDADMNYVESGTSYEDCVLASLKLTDVYLQRLKESDVFDNSVIILMADHGYYEDSRQNPMFLIKGVGEHHPLSISDAPLSYEDLPDAYHRLLSGCAAEVAFPWQEGDMRERRFLDYIFYGEDEMHEYLQVGPANEMAALLPTGNVFLRQGDYIKKFSLEDTA